MRGSADGLAWWRPLGVHEPHHSARAGAKQPASLRVPYGLLMAFVLVTILAPQDHFSSLKPLHIAFVTGGLACITYLYARLTGTAGEVVRSPALRIAILLLIWALVTVPFSIWPGGSFATISDALIKSLIVFWLLMRVVNSSSRLRSIAWTFSIIALPLSLSAIIAFAQVGFGNVGMLQGWDRITGYQSALTGNPNDLALMINLTLPFTIGLFITARRVSSRLALLFIGMLDVVAVIATYSRGGFITLVTIACAYFLCLSARARRGLLFVLLAIGLVGIPLMPSGYLSRLSTITNYQADRTDSAQQRWSDMVIATKLIVAHPIIGAGAGMDYLALNANRGVKWKHVHNVYLEYGVDLGLPGLVLFLLLFYRVFKGAHFARKSSMGDPRREQLHRLSEAALVAVVAFGVSAMFHPIAYEFYFFYVAGLALAAEAITLRELRFAQEGPLEDTDEKPDYASPLH